MVSNTYPDQTTSNTLSHSETQRLASADVASSFVDRAVLISESPRVRSLGRTGVVFGGLDGALSMANGKQAAILDADGTIWKHGETQPYDGALEFIQTLGSAGLDLAIVSNNPDRELAEARAEALGLAIDHVITPRRASESKPSPFMIRKALEKLEADPASVVGVGDGVTDMIAYRLAGVRNLSVVRRDTKDALGYPYRPKVRKAWYGLADVAGL